MNTIHTRRIRLEPQNNRGDESILFFEQGNITQPLFLITPYQTIDLLTNIFLQLNETELKLVRNNLNEVIKQS